MTGRTRARTRAPRRAVWAVALLVGTVLLAGCGGTRGGAPRPTTTLPSKIVRAGVYGDRYCEVLLVAPGADGSTSAEVYNSYPLNDCPAAKWEALDAAALAADAGVPAVVLNGPRYWLMDRIEKAGGVPRRRTFGGIEMMRQASVTIGSGAARAPFQAAVVTRRSVFEFDAGRTVNELLSSDGSRWVMQTWSQQKDPSLTSADLATLGTRLELPSGWRYETRRLDRPLRIDTTVDAARVLQDNLGNSYSLVPVD